MVVSSNIVLTVVALILGSPLLAANPTPTTLAKFKHVQARNDAFTPQPPTPQPPGYEPAGCEKQIIVGWEEAEEWERTINFCYPRLVPTCQRIAKVAFAKWTDFCTVWEEDGRTRPHSCDWKQNKEIEHICKGCDHTLMEFRIPGPSRCCPQPWEGLDAKEYREGDNLCRTWGPATTDEYIYYTQNFPLFGIYDEPFNYDNMTVRDYDRARSKASEIAVLDASQQD